MSRSAICGSIGKSFFATSLIAAASHQDELQQLKHARDQGGDGGQRRSVEHTSAASTFPM